MFRTGRAWGVAALLAVSSVAVAGQAAKANFGAHRPSVDTRLLAQWVLDSADHRGLPFAIVDKKDARIYVFERDGRLSGASSALLGQTPGDDSAPGAGANAQAGDVPVAERTTPSGRFLSEPGLNLDGERVVWIDYAAALAIHRVRPGASWQARQARLASATPRDNRVSLGCVVVAPEFYDDVIDRVLGRSRGVVYVLPEKRPLREIFNTL